MVEKFLEFISQNQLFEKDDKIMLAVSGGMDSVVMTDVFNKAGFDFALAHANFGLRNEDSDADELFVKKLAKKYKVACFTRHFDTENFAMEEAISIQMAARALRYHWFEELLRGHDFQYLATAHHQNDALETALLNFTKGTGISGLHGIAAKKGKVIRPMLFADKEMIYDYLVERQLAWREDSSNESNKYQRNLLRNEVVPLLKQINPDLEQTFVQTVERVRGAEQVFLRIVEEAKARLTEEKSGHVYISIDAVKELPQGGIILAELLKPFHFNYSQSKQLWERLGLSSGKIFDSPTHRLNQDRGHLIISPNNLQKFQSMDVPGEMEVLDNERFYLHFSRHEVQDAKIINDKKLALLDLDMLKFPLMLRKWKSGDWFIPLGMKKKKKLSDFMIDEKIPLNLKEEVYLLVSGDSVAWVVGHRIDDRFKITAKTKQVYQAKFVARS